MIYNQLKGGKIMNVKRFLLASLAVYITFLILDFLIHNVALASAYEENASLWRSDMSQIMWLMYLVGIAMALLFVYIFIKGYQGKGISEGIRYGLLIGLLISVIGILNQYIIYPLPFGLVAIWMVTGLIEFIIAGIVVSLVYKK
ncbi:MAG: hypothetical protein JW833_07195 [Prolixibacteraceae bacterium]|nr:hypothetical protein [Prolixibacteraceae bacterium]